MIAEGYKTNFETLKLAGRHGDLALVECTDRNTGKPVITICAMMRDRKGNMEMAPLAKMFDGNPYEELLPPSAEDPVFIPPVPKYVFKTTAERLLHLNGKLCTVVEDPDKPYDAKDNMRLIRMEETGETLGAFTYELSTPPAG